MTLLILDTKIEVSEETREKLLLTGRKIGDLDIIGIDGYKFGKNYADMARNVQSTSTEIKEIYKELENPTQTKDIRIQ